MKTLALGIATAMTLALNGLAAPSAHAGVVEGPQWVQDAFEIKR